MDIVIRPVTLDDGDKLLAFERENKAWFERFVPARPDNFWTVDGIRASLTSLIAEMTAGTGCFLIALNGQNTIMGRINVSVPHPDAAEIGYRVGQIYIGQGVAQNMLDYVCTTIAPQMGLKRLLAQADQQNGASVRVLVKSGFVFQHLDHDAAQLQGRSIDLAQYMRVLE